MRPCSRGAENCQKQKIQQNRQATCRQIRLLKCNLCFMSEVHSVKQAGVCKMHGSNCMYRGQR